MTQRQVQLAGLEGCFNFDPSPPRDWLAGFEELTDEENSENCPPPPPPSPANWMDCQPGTSAQARAAQAQGAAPPQAPPPQQCQGPAPNQAPRPLGIIFNIHEPLFWLGAVEVRTSPRNMTPDFLVTVAMHQGKQAYQVCVKQILANGGRGFMVQLSHKEATEAGAHLITAASLAETDRDIYRYPATTLPTHKWRLRHPSFWDVAMCGEDFVLRTPGEKLMVRPFISDSGWNRVLCIRIKKAKVELLNTSPMGALELGKSLLEAGESARANNLSISMDAILQVTKHPLFPYNR